MIKNPSKKNPGPRYYISLNYIGSSNTNLDKTVGCFMIKDILAFDFGLQFLGDYSLKSFRNLQHQQN